MTTLNIVSLAKSTEIQNVRAAATHAVDKRAHFEACKSSNETVTLDNAYDVLATSNKSMRETLKDIRKTFDNDVIAQAIASSAYNVERINVSERANTCINVYAIEKDVNALRASVSAARLNHYTRAILLAAKLFAANNMTMTHNDAQSACSMSVKSRDAKKEKLLSTVKYQKHVATTTASTQASSSLSTLLALNVMRETRDNANVACFVLNTDSEIATRLLERC